LLMILLAYRGGFWPSKWEILGSWLLRGWRELCSRFRVVQFFPPPKDEFILGMASRIFPGVPEWQFLAPGRVTEGDDRWQALGAPLLRAWRFPDRPDQYVPGDPAPGFAPGLPDLRPEPPSTFIIALARNGAFSRRRVVCSLYGIKRLYSLVMGSAVILSRGIFDPKRSWGGMAAAEFCCLAPGPTEVQPWGSGLPEGAILANSLRSDRKVPNTLCCLNQWLALEGRPGPNRFENTLERPESFVRIASGFFTSVKADWSDAEKSGFGPAGGRELRWSHAMNLQGPPVWRGCWNQAVCAPRDLDRNLRLTREWLSDDDELPLPTIADAKVVESHEVS